MVRAHAHARASRGFERLREAYERLTRGFDRIPLSLSVSPRRLYCNGTVPLHKYTKGSNNI